MFDMTSLVLIRVCVRINIIEFPDLIRISPKKDHLFCYSTQVSLQSGVCHQGWSQNTRRCHQEPQFPCALDRQYAVARAQEGISSKGNLTGVYIYICV